MLRYFERFDRRSRVRAAAARRPTVRHSLEHVHASCCRSTAMGRSRKAFIDAMRRARHRHRRVLRGDPPITLFRAQGLPARSVPRTRTHRPRDGHAAALPRDARSRRRARLRGDAPRSAPRTGGHDHGAAPQLSVVDPGLQRGGRRCPRSSRACIPALDALGVPYEIIFVNDGSRDRSAAMLREQFQKRPDVTRVILFNGNFGQHMAIMAGFEQVPRRAHRDAGRRPAEPARGDRQAARQDGRGPRLRRRSIRRKRQDAAWRRCGIARR